jgi:hypothetical protein
MIYLANRVQETSTTVGTGTFTLNGAVTGYRTFTSALGNGNKCIYTIEHQSLNEWEIGFGTIGSGTLARNSILESSSANTAVNFSAGTKNVFVSAPVDSFVGSRIFQSNLQDFTFNATQGGTSSFTIGTQGGSGQSGSILASSTYSDAVGICRLISGTSANLGVGVLSPGSTTAIYKAGLCAMDWSARVNVSALSSATNRYVIRMGMVVNTYNADPANGIIFRYTDNVNSGNWQCVCRNAGSESVINTTVAPIVSGSGWDYMNWVINDAGTSVEFFINGISRGSLTTNIPSVLLISGIYMNKISGSSSQNLDIDWFDPLMVRKMY